MPRGSGRIARSRSAARWPARCAFWLGLTLVMRGEQVRGGGWLGRAQRLAEESSLDCAERGYLRIPAALQALDRGDHAAAHTAFDEVIAIAD